MDDGIVMIPVAVFAIVIPLGNQVNEQEPLKVLPSLGQADTGDKKIWHKISYLKSL